MKIKDLGVKLADGIAAFVGSWTFIIIQSLVLIVWVYMNSEHLVHFDPYPFILMNLFLSFQAAYATPMILMSSNRQAAKDREELLKDLKVDENSNIILQDIIILLNKINEDIALNKQALAEHKKILEELEKIKNKKPKTKNVL